MSKAVAQSDAVAPGGADPDPLVGKVLDGRFRIVERLGAGGMGTVYKAVQAPLDRLVALKVLNTNYDSKRDPGFHRRFFLEASVTSKLKHPNTITVIDYGKTEDGIYYLAMEYVEGVTLAQVLVSEGTLSWQRCLHVSQQICRSLREAHRAGIIHRDLKPANVMVCSEETDNDLVKVLDFGLVKSFQADGIASEGAELTQAGVFLGSPQYMAPEQARNVADPRSDIYSLGVVMFQMLTGKPPFVAEQSIDVIVKHMKEPPPPMRAVKPDLQLPAEVEALVLRCLEKDPARRFQSMDEALEALRVCGAAAGLSGVFGPGSRQIPNTPGPMGQLTPTGAHRQGLTPTPSGPQRLANLPQTGAHRTAANRTGSGAYRVGSATFDISVESSQAQSGVLSAARPVSATRRALRYLVLASIFAASLAGGLAVIVLLTRETKPIVAPTRGGTAGSTAAPASTPQAPDPSTVVPVRFRVVSEPLGATVRLAGRPVGTTPHTFEVAPGPDGSASAELTLELAGYERAAVTAAGSGPEVVVSQRLRRVPPPPPPPRQRVVQPKPKPKPAQSSGPKPSGYKDDPY